MADLTVVDSDVDLLVTWSEETSLLDQAALMLELESLLGRKVDIASDGWAKPFASVHVHPCPSVARLAEGAGPSKNAVGPARSAALRNRHSRSRTG